MLKRARGQSRELKNAAILAINKI